MNFIIKQEVLKELIKNLGSLLSAKVSMEILNGVLFDLSDKGFTVTASDGVETISQRISEVVTKETGACIIPRDFLRTVVKLSGEIEFSLEGNQLTVVKNKTRLQSMVFPADEFPAISAEKPSYQLKYTGKQWEDIVTSTAYAASTSEIRPVLQGVHIDVSATGQKFVCTDTHRLGEIKFSQDGITEELAITLPAKTLQATLNSFDLAKDVKVVGFRNHVALFNSNIIHMIRAIEGNYPPTSRLIPETFNTEIVLARMDLLENMKLLNSMLKSDSPIVTFTLDSQLSKYHYESRNQEW